MDRDIAYSLKRKMTIFENQTWGMYYINLPPPPPQKWPHFSQAPLPAAVRSKTGSGR